MLPLMAKLTVEPDNGTERRSKRRTLRLEVGSSTIDSGSRSYVLNLSETGLLLESQTRLATGDTIEVELPHAGIAVTRVVWTNEAFAGCEFVVPISTATVSAALLLAPFERAPARPPTDWLAYEQRAREADLRPTPESELQVAGFAVLASLMLAAFVVLAFLYVLLTLPS
jgi:hypothetical protein